MAAMDVDSAEAALSAEPAPGPVAAPAPVEAEQMYEISMYCGMWGSLHRLTGFHLQGARTGRR